MMTRSKTRALREQEHSRQTPRQLAQEVSRIPLPTYPRPRSPPPINLQPPKQPAVPSRWDWRCHQCHRVWRITVTMRCLRCSHRNCSSNPYARSPCATSFDYEGWGRHNEWRRDMADYEGEPAAWARRKKALESKLARAKSQLAKREVRIEERRQVREQRWKGRLGRMLGEGEQRNCWEDCDFPSECLFERHKYAIQMWEEAQDNQGRERLETIDESEEDAEMF